MNHDPDTPADSASSEQTHARQEGLHAGTPDDPGALAGAHLARPKPPGLRELSPRAILVGLVIAALMGASYPYVVLKLGFGPNVSVVAAILGYIALGLVFTWVVRVIGIQATPYNRWENNIVQTAGTAGAQTAFMCVLLAAFDMLAQSKLVSFNIALSEVQAFAWLTAAGLLGVFLAVPLRRHYIVDEKLPFPDGMAAGETVLVCDSAGPIAARAALAMVLGIVASGVLMTLTEESHVFKYFSSTYILNRERLPELIVLGVPVASVTAATAFGIEWSLLAIGSGMLIGMRINLSMLVGTALSWVVAPILLLYFGILNPGFKRNDVLFWVMWPATGMMVAGGLAALLLRWRVLARTFQNLTAGSAGNDEFPLRWVVIGAALSAIALIVLQKVMLGQAVWITTVAILLSAPLALVGLRVLGETNWGPISALSNMMQGVFAVIAPGNVPANMVASGTTGTVAVSSEAIMQDYKAGDMVGSSPRNLTTMQLLATPVGAAAVAWMYPLLRAQYGIGDTGLSSPISRKWAGFAEILSAGFSALPTYALEALIIGSLVGVLLAILESTLRSKTLVPSPTGLGIGMLVPASVIVTMVVGGLIAAVWSRASKKSSEVLMVPLASGLIAGEALVAVIVPLLVLLGVLRA
jgi:uncharacterized oligopeptide transporter (OPT) family protein